MIDRRALAPGFEIPTFAREGTFHHWSRFAGAHHEFADHHMDDAVGRHEGFAAAVAMAPLTHAYMYALLRSWIGEDDGWVAAVSVRFRRPFLRSRTLTGHGRITEVGELRGDTIVDLVIWADDDTGTRIVDGTGKVVLGS